MSITSCLLDAEYVTVNSPAALGGAVQYGSQGQSDGNELKRNRNRKMCYVDNDSLNTFVRAE